MVRPSHHCVEDNYNEDVIVRVSVSVNIPRTLELPVTFML